MVRSIKKSFLFANVIIVCLGLIIFSNHNSFSAENDNQGVMHAVEFSLDDFTFSKTDGFDEH